VKARWLAGLLPLVLAQAAFLAPIRVGVFRGHSPGIEGGWPFQTASNAISAVLENPGSQNLGPGLVVPSEGFRYDQFGVSGTPSTQQKETFLSALDSLDAVIFLSNDVISGIFTDSASRGRIIEFAKRKGLVSVYFSSESISWPAWDSLHGGRFVTLTPNARMATLHLDTAARREAIWRFLNKGLPDTARFQEYWSSFRPKGDTIRNWPGLRPTVRLDEASVEGGLASHAVMGDHPISWYRVHEAGGRFFYTGLGYRTQNYTGTDAGAFFVRRQIYNAILWAAGVDSTGAVSVRNPQVTREGRGFTDAARLSLSGGTLTVSLLRDGAHTVEILGLDGRRVASRRGAGRGGYAFENLRPGAVYAVTVTAGGQRFTRMAVIK
jgi:hypothetical protein